MVLPAVLSVLILVSLLIRVSVRDAYVWSAAVFYMSPWPVLLSAWPLIGLWKRKRRWSRAIAAAGFAITLGAWMMRETPPPLPFPAALSPGSGGSSFSAKAPGELRVLFWNIGHPARIPATLDELLSTHQPDILVLAEAGQLDAAQKEQFLADHPSWQAERLEGGLMAAARGRLAVEKSLRLPNRTRAHRLQVWLEGRTEPWILTVGDVGPWPLTPRADRIHLIRSLAGNEPRSLILGDFNTPYDSCAFDAWRQDLHHGLSQAPESPGAATWPLGIPLLAIDHVWMSRDLLPVRAWKGTPWGHDHAWQIISIQAVPLPGHQPERPASS